MYAVWIDETLNITLRSIAARAHRMTFDKGIHGSFAMIANLRLNSYLCEAEEEEVNL